MKLTVTRADLHRAIAAVGKIVPRRTTIPILGNVLLRADSGHLRLTATNLDIEARVAVPAEIAASGAVTVPAAMLADIVAKLPADAVVRLDAEADIRIVLRAGRARFVLPTLPVADYPEIPPGPLPHTFMVPAATISSVLAHLMFAISTEETRYYLNGVHLHPEASAGTDEPPRLVAVATDGHRLAKTVFACSEPMAGLAAMPGVIVPRETCAEIARLARGGDAHFFEVSTAKIRISSGDVVITSKLIDGTFPDYGRVIPTANEKRALVHRDALADVVDRVATVSNERGRAVKLSFAGDTLTLSVNNPDAGSANEEIEIEYDDAEPLDIGFNARYLAEILRTLDGDRTRIALDTAGSPTLFRPDDNADPRLIVLMPLRV